MIEVEKKFLLTKDQEKKLIEGAEFIGEKVFTDIYYDTQDYQLTANDKWLRQRAGKWELKVSFNKDAANRKGDLYDELEDDGKIKKFFNFPAEKDLNEALKENGHAEFCICKTTRKKYKKHGFGIDIDLAEFEDESGPWHYELAEIELMVQDKKQMPEALEKIISFAKENGLETGYVRGKILVYLKEKKPEHFQALVDAGVARA